MSAERIAVVTGASSGIGLEAARLLAAQGWRVLGVGRDPARCREAREALRESTGSTRVDFETADLYALLNNAGTFLFSRAETRDGIELQLAVNHLAGFLLTTGLLLPLLQASPAARAVTTSSGRGAIPPRTSRSRTCPGRIRTGRYGRPERHRGCARRGRRTR